MKYWSVICNNTKNITQLQGNIELKIFKEPAGVLVNDIFVVQDFETFIIALAYGNAVIITNGYPELNSFFEYLIKILPTAGFPAGLFNVIFRSNDDIINQRFLNIPLICHPSNLMYNDERKCYEVQTREKILNAVAYNKCIWTTFGETLL